MTLPNEMNHETLKVIQFGFGCDVYPSGNHGVDYEGIQTVFSHSLMQMSFVACSCFSKMLLPSLLDSLGCLPDVSVVGEEIRDDVRIELHIPS
jgi:hypothetical protein